MYTENYKIRFEDLDMTGKMGLFSFIKLAQHMATVNGEQLGVGYDILLEKKMCWVAVRAHYEFENEIECNNTMILKTWPENSRHMLYPRMYHFTDTRGNTIMKGCVQWSLYSFERGKALSGKDAGIDLEGETRPEGFEVGMPSRIKIGETEKVTVRTVQFSDTDANGHMNNCNYVNYVMDLLPIDTIKRCKVKTLDINYNRQIPVGKDLTMRYTISDSGVIVSGECESNNIFTMKIQFAF